MGVRAAGALLSSPQVPTDKGLFFGQLLAQVGNMSPEERLDGSYLATGPGVDLSRRSEVVVNRGTAQFPALLFSAAAWTQGPSPSLVCNE